MGSQKEAGGTIEGMVREGTLTQDLAQRQLDLGHGDQTVATVAWMGYDTPPGLAQAGNDNLAHAGAVPLSQYLESLDVTTTQADQHLTLVGRSYGSLTSGLALQGGASL